MYHGPEELRVTTRHGDGGSPVSASLQEMYGLVNRAKEANSKVTPTPCFWIVCKVMVMWWKVHRIHYTEYLLSPSESVTNDSVGPGVAEVWPTTRPRHGLTNDVSRDDTIYPQSLLSPLSRPDAARTRDPDTWHVTRGTDILPTCQLQTLRKVKNARETKLISPTIYLQCNAEKYFISKNIQ